MELLFFLKRDFGVCLNNWREAGFTLDYLCGFLFMIAKGRFLCWGIGVNANLPVLQGRALLSSQCNATAAWDTRCPTRNATIRRALQCPTYPVQHRCPAGSTSPCSRLSPRNPSTPPPRFWAPRQAGLSKHAFAQRDHESQKSAVLRKKEYMIAECICMGILPTAFERGFALQSKTQPEPTNLLNEFWTEIPAVGVQKVSSFFLSGNLQK